MKEKIRVLFIGNSHTYYNDMGYILKFFSEQNLNIHPIVPVMVAHPYKTLEEHKTEPEIRFNILYGEYDYIVLQQAAHPFPGEDILIRDGMEINKFIRNTSSKPIVYMTWAEKAHPENQEIMTDAYFGLAKKINALVAPAGTAFEKLRKTAPYIEIFDKDGCHASVVGSYLVACIFYSVIYRISPLRLPNKIMYNNKCLFEIDKDVAELLQNIAWETVVELQYR